MKEYKYTINGDRYEVVINEVSETTAKVSVNGTEYNVEWEKPEEKKPVTVVRPVASKPAAPAASAPAAQPTPNAVKGHSIKTPLPGVIIDIKVNVGDTVSKGQTVVILEAMKMENNINADKDGKVIAIQAAKGDTVADGATLIVLE